jgi:hypothetical protein
MDVIELLESKVADSHSFPDVIHIVAERLAADVKPFFLEGLRRISGVVIARPFTSYGWLLAIYEALGMTRGGALIVYYNSRNPRWTASTLIHEVIHIALGVEREIIFNAMADEVLAYVASFKSGFQDIYLNGIRQGVELLSHCINPYSEREILDIIVPRLLAHRLVAYNYARLVETLLHKPEAALSLWMSTNLREEEVQALAVALEGASVGSDIGLPKPKCSTVSNPAYDSSAYMLEEVDKNFLEMKRILDMAARNADRTHEILKPWWSELGKIRDELEAYLYLQGRPEA